jgi:predicted nucleotidyltransferase
MKTTQGHRQPLLAGLLRFVATARQITGVRRIAVLGSIVTTKPNPKDIDVLVVVADDADLAPLAKSARQLQGYAQGFNRGADVFLADWRGDVHRPHVPLEGLPSRCAPSVRCAALRSATVSSRRSRRDSFEHKRGSVAASHHLAIRRTPNRVATRR